jgi:hypothetical protein
VCGSVTFERRPGRIRPTCTADRGRGRRRCPTRASRSSGPLPAPVARVSPGQAMIPCVDGAGDENRTRVLSLGIGVRLIRVAGLGPIQTPEQGRLERVDGLGSLPMTADVRSVCDGIAPARRCSSSRQHAESTTTWGQFQWPSRPRRQSPVGWWELRCGARCGQPASAGWSGSVSRGWLSSAIEVSER